ncbi:MAG: hypothetical protein U5J83_02770 [Bryobacterales bacterium]|nr:hypothetical protein [Bryobacterales bacterium]
MLREILIQEWTALRRNPTRSLLTMTGIMWVVSVALLFAYGSGFRGQSAACGFRRFRQVRGGGVARADERPSWGREGGEASQAGDGRF